MSDGDLGWRTFGGSRGRYIVMSGFSFSLNVGLTVALHETIGLAEEAACLTALVTVFVINFFGQRHFVFQAQRGDAKRQVIRFCITSWTCRSAEYLGFLLLHSLLGEQYVLALLFVLIVSFCFKYAIFKAMVFQPTAHFRQRKIPPRRS